MSVYFIGEIVPEEPDVISNYVKVGFTDQSVEQRLAALQTGNPRKLELLGEFRCLDQADEKALHDMFVEHRLRGEWFEYEHFEELIGQQEELLTQEAVWQYLSVDYPRQGWECDFNIARKRWLEVSSTDAPSFAASQIVDALRLVRSDEERKEVWRLVQKMGEVSHTLLLEYAGQRTCERLEARAGTHG